MASYRLVLILSGLLLSLSAQALSLQGRTEFAEPMQINAATAGVIRNIAVKPGQIVKSGELLIELDDTPHQARLNKAKGLQLSLAPAVTTAELEFDRAQELYDRDSLSQVELTMAESRLSLAQGEYQAATAEVERYAYELSQTRIKAPAVARVVAIMANHGYYLDPAVTGSPVLMLASANQMRATALIDAQQWSPALLNRKARVSFNGQSFPGVVDQLGLIQSDPANAKPAYELHVLFDNRRMLAAGLPVSIEILD